MFCHSNQCAARRSPLPNTHLFHRSLPAVAIADSQFLYNSAENDAGAMLFGDTRVNLTDVTVMHNTAKAKAGGVAFFVQGTWLLTRCNIS